MLEDVENQVWCKIIVEELLDLGIHKKNIIFIDLDSLENKKIKTPDALEQLIKKLSVSQEKKYLFIDEIQNIKNFEEVINGFRTDGGYSIFITGSNSYLLSGELVTKLTGRYLEFEMFPLSFSEYEEMKKFYNKPIDTNPIVELNNYILEGSFPRIIQIEGKDNKRKYLQGIIEEIFEKDIRKRVKIKNKKVFERIRIYLINNFGTTTSITNISKILKQNGLQITKETLSKYIKVLIDAKILYECPRFDMKLKRSLCGEKKYYLADLGFYYTLNTNNQIEYSNDLENILYIYARSHDYSISVGKIGKLECDFILRDVDLNYSYVQVAYSILQSQETLDREIKPLESVKDNYPKYVMTLTYLFQKRNGIKHVNILDFIKENSEFN